MVAISHFPPRKLTSLLTSKEEIFEAFCGGGEACYFKGILFIYLFVFLSESSALDHPIGYFIFPLYSKGIKLSLHVYITFFPHPLFCCNMRTMSRYSCCNSWEFLSWMSAEFCQMLFLHLLRWSWFLLMWYITLIDLQIVNYPLMPGISHTWLWCMILFIYCWI